MMHDRIHGDRLEVLLRARLASLKDGSATPARLQRDLARLLPRTDADVESEVASALDRLATRNEIARGRGSSVTLTDEGRRAAMEWFGPGIASGPLRWRSCTTRFLPARILGFAAKDRRDAGSATEFVRAAVGLRVAGVTEGPVTPARARRTLLARRIEALTGQESGTLDPGSGEVRGTFASALLSSLAGSPTTRIPPDRLVALIAARAVDADDVAREIIRRWLVGRDAFDDLSGLGGAASATQPPPHSPPPPRPATPATIDLGRFAALVNETARACPAEIRPFGGPDVLVADVWDRLRERPELAEFDLEKFKSWLAKGLNQRMLRLIPADSGKYLDRERFRRSATRFQGFDYHMIRA